MTAAASRPRAIGVLGASGGVGAAAVAQLDAWGAGPLRLGGRDSRRLQRLVDDLALAGAEAVGVDLYAGDELARFCAGCRIVVNCAGPSHAVGDRVATAALAAGADYVDPGGDEPLHHRCAGGAGDRVAVVSAGSVPGLSALLVRALAADAEDSGAGGRLLAFAGGRGRFTFAAAADYLMLSATSAGTPLAVWRDGAVRPAAASTLLGIQLPYFPGRVDAHPYVSHELARVAGAAGLAEAVWYAVFDGAHVARAVQTRTARAGGEQLDGAARALSRAAELDLFGREPYQLFVVGLDGRTLVLRGRDPIAVTGAVTALATLAVDAGELPPGAHFAGEALSPEPALRRLQTAAAVDALQRPSVTLAGAAAGAELVEEGVL
ncbi:MAG: saccharopine dehydrogenase NADP-binding domain-containing protein [Solirubrobacteraceae bacterium]